MAIIGKRPCNSFLFAIQNFTFIILVFEHLCKFMYDIHNQLAPINLINFLKKIHAHRIRATANENFYIECSRTEKLGNSFSSTNAHMTPVY